jgi:hypothetical protein
MKNKNAESFVTKYSMLMVPCKRVIHPPTSNHRCNAGQKRMPENLYLSWVKWKCRHPKIPVPFVTFRLFVDYISP